MQTEAYKSVLEQMLVQHVFPEFSSLMGHIRAKLHGDSELPIRVDSVVSLCSFVKACEDLDEMKPVLPQLLSGVVLAQIPNFAAAFWKCMNTAEEEDEADDDSGTFAVGCLSAISTVLDSSDVKASRVLIATRSEGTEAREFHNQNQFNIHRLVFEE
ncbi:unnamed protein product [Lactuca virosa]|uniref:Uncharacterized protein n=1 Tax=Lactuca virosa TaxID=75947 RepID=A0AAU9NEG9_9ASTR|nr:unnamed protein product [Lactuca virosa]